VQSAAEAPAIQPIVAEPVPANIGQGVGIAPTATASAGTLPNQENSRLEGGLPAPAMQGQGSGPTLAPDSSMAPAPRKPAQRRNSPAGTPKLERKGNERYGRFE
jgi:hypothetical protein